MEPRLFRYDMIVWVDLLSRNPKKLGRSNDQADEDLRENGAEMTGNDIY